MPGARLTICGFRPTRRSTFAGRDGIELKADLPDLRDEIARHGVVVLPFESGGGIKNKLLEAASMARPIVCTPKAAEGLVGDPPLIVCAGAAKWVDALRTLWQDAARRRDAGDRARTWVTTYHSWDQAARSATHGIEASLGARPGAGVEVGREPA